LLGSAMGDEEDKRSSKDYYYRLLRVDRSATPAEIKKAYHNLALRLHPDKNSNNENSEEWVQIQTAYEVLSDPGKRKIYDKFGIQGLQAQAMYGNVLPPGLLAHGLAMIGMIVCTTALLLLLFVIFAGLRAGDSVTWRWTTVFVPLWILDGAILIFIVKDWVAYCRRDKRAPDADDVGGPPGIGAFVFSTMLVLQILVDLKLEGFAIAPMVVVIPLLILFGCLCLCCCLVACVGLVVGQASHDPGGEGEEPSPSAPLNDNDEERGSPPENKEETVQIHEKRDIAVRVDADAMD